MRTVLALDAETNRNAQTLFRGLRRRLNGLSVFKMSTDLLGIVHHTAQLGDSIVLLQEGQVPFILSPVPDGWLLVAPAYIDGLMQGEAWPDDENQLVEFVLV